jgi:hypothetical protein
MTMGGFSPAAERADGAGWKKSLDSGKNRNNRGGAEGLYVRRVLRF